MFSFAWIFLGLHPAAESGGFDRGPESNKSETEPNTATVKWRQIFLSILSINSRRVTAAATVDCANASEKAKGAFPQTGETMNLTVLDAPVNVLPSCRRQSGSPLPLPGVGV